VNSVAKTETTISEELLHIRILVSLSACFEIVDLCAVALLCRGRKNPVGAGKIDRLN
jgi:hypothetical protein